MHGQTLIKYQNIFGFNSCTFYALINAKSVYISRVHPAKKRHRITIINSQNGGGCDQKPVSVHKTLDSPTS
jgi:hypothetical protein